ncbi:DUF6671 family protein [Anaerobacillus isosaccharinicus]|uniref:DUF6671 family protein n=2 Tax=Anaerobacillus isosaccharinicus TaxID=1532552 RepID=A0A7S7RDX7_9BACI|nr:DUF6671 family protein [Anaerobacillus isosaccharinicus]
MDKKAKKLFDGREAVIATMHKKEEVIAPILKSELGINITVPHEFNSDVFGTFTNEVERMGDQLEAARKKVEVAMLQSGLNIGIASEGSFGPHPIFSFAPFNRELILFVDKDLDLELTGYVANGNTNYAQKEVGSFEEAYEFAKTIGFPEHGVIVKKNATTTDQNEIIKGITDVNRLRDSVTTFTQSQPTAFVETDMRAMYNPIRMSNIKLATLDLVSKMNSLCPNCQTPGFEVIEVKKGLPCHLCGFPTNMPLLQINECKKCKHQKETKYPNGNKHADPTYCNVCNP